ncbi:CapA family protein [bacterium]|nr:CapA family protein [bacterium]
MGGHSAFFDPSNAPPAFNPLNLAADAPGIDRLRIWLDRGRDDYARYGFDLMHATLTQRGIGHEYVVYPTGEHNNAYWSAHVADYLAFYAAEWDNVITPETLLPPTATPDASVPTLLEQAAQRVFVPVVAFPAPRSSITLDRLRRVAAGEVDPDLMVDAATAEGMQATGFTLNRFTRIVPPDELLPALWQAAREERPAWGLLGWDALSPHYRVLHVAQPDGTAVHPLVLRGYPLAAAGEPVNFDPARLTRITFSGVTALARNTLAALDTNGVDWAAEGILPYVQQADYFHISNEVSFAPRCPQSDQPVLGGLCSKDAHFDLFTRLGVDIVELTGNHNNDYGFDVYRRTLGLYADAGMQTVGGGETIADARAPLILDHNGTRIGLFACNFNGPEFALASDALGAERPGAAFCVIDGWLREAIPTLKDSVDVVVVLVQYAEYDRYRPIERQMFHFRALADAGADVVLGSQAHRPQTFELYETPSGATTFIHYGLGNLFFDQPGLENRQFFMDTTYFYDGRLLTVDLFSGVIEDLARPRPMTPDEQAGFLRMMLIEYGDLLLAAGDS